MPSHSYNDKVQKPNSYTVYSSHCILESISLAKYLCVDNTLGFFRRNIKIHSKSLKSSAYKVLDRPQLEYCSTVWCPFTDSNISKLESVQRRAARCVKHDYGQTFSVKEMRQSLQWGRLAQWRIDNKLSLMYKITHNLIAIPNSDFLIPLLRPSRHYHPFSYRLITATTD